MMRVSVCSLLVALLSGPAFSQSAETELKFEASDIHSSPHINQPVVRGPFYTAGRLEVRFASMLDLIRIAYGVEPEKIAGGPSWLEMERFDVFAKTPAASNAETRKKMLQALLADRFALTMHDDSRPVTAYALTVSKRAQLKEPDGSGEGGCNFTVQNAPPQNGTPPSGPINLPVILYTCKNITMDAFATGMPAMAGAGNNFGSQPVVDRTALKGAWDFSLRYTPKVPAGIPVVGENIPLFDALEQQLGLKLELSTTPMPVMVVDHVNRKPTGNAADLDKIFPPLPTEFEVAEIKPSPGQAGGGGVRPELKNGRLYLPGITLKNLIAISFDINGDEMLSGAQKWMDEDKFDVIAKAPAGVALGDLTPNRNGISFNLDAIRPMLRALVVDRFKLVTHTEDRPLNAYTLVAVKPRLKKADPNSRTRWQEGIAPDAKNNKNANSALGRLVTCQNLSMAEFADLLSGIAPGYIHTKVVDATGLEGGWDFTFSFSPIGALQLAGQTSSDSEASEPSATVSLFDAMVKQLGLKLETQKRPTPVVVIDSVQRKPTDQ